MVQACAQPDEFEQRGVGYHFIAPERGPNGIARTRAFAALLAQLKPDVLHVHGLGFSAEVRALAAQGPRIPILLQDHADRLPRLWRRWAWRRGAARAAGVAACAVEQVAPVISAQLFSPCVRTFSVPESTSRFACGDRDAARRTTAVVGDPAVLWVGRLDANKDPLAVLEGVRRAIPALPNLALWCCFGAAPLRHEVERRIEADSALRSRVRLLGTVPHERVELLMRAADLYVSASHREGSGEPADRGVRLAACRPS